ncbi:MAG: HAD-IIIA family hydrolase [Phycisphaerae bacterium]|nr:HAD-IIIA family hydrolase [Phycisphaerae bacterium]
MGPAVFIDRDDTLVDTRRATAGTDHPGDLLDPALVSLLPGAGAACARLADAGYALVVVSNQGAVARDRCALEDVESVNDRLRELLAQAGAALAATYYCPFHPAGEPGPFSIEHPWRKPAPGMIAAATRELDLDLRGSWLVGDSLRDIQAGLAAGLARSRTILVSQSAPMSEGAETEPGAVLPHLSAAADFILTHPSFMLPRGAPN